MSIDLCRSIYVNYCPKKINVTQNRSTKPRSAPVGTHDTRDYLVMKKCSNSNFHRKCADLPTVPFVFCLSRGRCILCRPRADPKSAPRQVQHTDLTSMRECTQISEGNRLNPLSSLSHVLESEFTLQVDELPQLIECKPICRSGASQPTPEAAAWHGICISGS